ncbi:hypothetical protein AB6A40_009583 [Gnathostoma spinigerum]|uniref:Uncharacterized protein n=1 Tax=Gnathostoma spinigerum TaxID=75299 RepID=A0ABD6ESD3_9BILA
MTCNDKPLGGSLLAGDFTYMVPLTKDTLRTMTDEVDEALSEGEDEITRKGANGTQKGEDRTEQEENKRERKRKSDEKSEHSDVQEGKHSKLVEVIDLCESDSDIHISDSDDDVMAADIEKQFFS